MFKNGTRGASLSLIDYGSGTLETSDTEQTSIEQSDGKMLLQHTTFAGSAFYISPEMFQKKYTSKTDVWSAGVTLYVLVAGYPADALQKAFNMLQDAKEPEKRKEALKELPNVAKEIPETFWEMLEMALTYRQKNRSDAKEILSCDFVNFHKQINESSDIGLSLDDVLNDAAHGHSKTGESSISGKGHRTESVLLEGSVYQHKLFFRYGQFERSLTTLIATKLNQSDLEALLTDIDQFISDGKDNKSPAEYQVMANKKRLQIIKVEELRKLLENKKFNSM
jgi:serine/threonine protein kinase